MKKGRGINLDTAFNNFWQKPESGAFSYRLRTMPLYDAEIEKEIKRSARYAFFKGWEARAKRDAKRKKEHV